MARLVTLVDDGHTLAINPDDVRGIIQVEENVTRIQFSNGDWIEAGLPFHRVLDTLNSQVGSVADKLDKIETQLKKIANKR
jgi:hypothetical protein